VTRPPSPISKNQINKLGDRLAKSDKFDLHDLKMLEALLADAAAAMAVVEESLIELLEVQPFTSRVKNTGTIIEKLRRDRSRLSSIRDLAGVRVVYEMTRREQDELREEILEIWPSAEVIDRRLDPRSGYRAVHVIPVVDGHPVEIQIRTHHQDLWAQIAEALADVWGRGLRYRGIPDEPETPIAPGEQMSRADVWQIMRDLSETIDQHERSAISSAVTRKPTRPKRLSVAKWRAYLDQQKRHKSLKREVESTEDSVQRSLERMHEIVARLQ